MPEPPPPSPYILDESDPDIVILRRSDGSFVAAFSAQGVTPEAIIEAAQEDYRRLLAPRLSGEEKVKLDELTEHVAIVDRLGTIVAVNEAWKRFAEDNGKAEEASTPASSSRRGAGGKARKSQVDLLKTLAVEWRGENGVERLENRVGKPLADLTRAEADEWIDRLTPEGR
jgi:hypothetical protein